MREDIIFEAMGLIGDKYYEEAAKPRRERRLLIKWGAAAATAAAAAVIAFAVLPHFPGAQEAVPPDGAGDAVFDDGQQGEPGGESPETGSVDIRVNELDPASVTADMDVQYTDYDKLPYDVWQQVEAAFYGLIGVSYDDFTAKIPEYLRENMTFRSRATRGWKDGQPVGEYTLHDYVFECGTEEGPHAEIAICGFEEPLRNLYFMTDDPAVSDINGTQAVIYGYDDVEYFTSFCHNGVYYDIETTGMDLDSLVELLLSITS